MCIICTKQYNNDLTILNCSGCTQVTSIPLLENLTELHCVNCINLTTIPRLEKLTDLNCS